MERKLFVYIRRYSMRQQAILLTVTVCSFPFLYYSLELPKIIINEAINPESTDFPTTLTWLPGVWSQLEYLLLLCFSFLLLVLVNGGFKYHINIMRGTLGERLLRRLRYTLMARVLEFPFKRFRTLSSGEVVTMVTAETEPLGGFFGDSYVLPMFQGGIFLTIMIFMFNQNIYLGIAAMSLVPLQGYLIPKLQKQVNMLAKERIRKVRRLSDRIDETVCSVRDIRANGISSYTLADFSQHLHNIFFIRFNIYQKKFFMKFLNNFINQLTPFFFYLLGGYLVIAGDLSFGALVAVLAAYKELSAPWRLLLTYYQRMSDSIIKYEELYKKFALSPADEAQIQGHPEEPARLSGDEDLTLEFRRVHFTATMGSHPLKDISFKVGHGGRLLLTGHAGEGREEVALLMAGLVKAESGAVLLGGHDIGMVSEGLIAYAYGNGTIFEGTIFENVTASLQVNPPEPDVKLDGRFIREALASGNSVHSVERSWWDKRYESEDRTMLDRAALRCLRQAGAEADLLKLGLMQPLPSDPDPALVQGLLEARKVLAQRIQEQDLSRLVNGYDMNAFNEHMTVGDNILFGQPQDEAYAPGRLHTNPMLRALLKQDEVTALWMQQTAFKLVCMLHTLAEDAANQEVLEQLVFGSFSPQVLAGIIERAEGVDGELAHDQLQADDVDQLYEILLAHTPALQPLSLIGEREKKMILSLRHALRDAICAQAPEAVLFYDPAQMNTTMDIEKNILFGTPNLSWGEAQAQLLSLMTEVLEAVGIKEDILALALDQNTGRGGRLLSYVFGRRVLLARALIKDSRFLILDRILSKFSEAEQAMILDSLDASGCSVVICEEEASELWERFTSEEVHISAGQVSDGTYLATPNQDGGGQDNLSALAQKLSKIPLFSALPRSQLRLLSFTSEVKQFSDGDALCTEGEVGDSAYVILSGEVRVCVAQGKSYPGVEVARLQVNEIVGEVALLSNKLRTATVLALGEVEVLRISKEIFDLIMHNRQVNLGVMEMLIDRLTQSNK